MLQIPDNDILVLEDDVVLCEDFLGKLNHFISLIEYRQIEKGISLHESVQRPFAFTPIYIHEKKCNYTEAVSEHFFEHIGYNIFTQKYVDGIFYMSKELHHQVKDWFTHEEVPVLKSSSGIGKFLSQKMYGAKFNMYGISPSLIGHGDHESIQFGEKRKQFPLIAKI
jgi:GR25 family glycosyltransferase involved in LPS biosynthesis